MVRRPTFLVGKSSPERVSSEVAVIDSGSRCNRESFGNLNLYHNFKSLQVCLPQCVSQVPGCGVLCKTMHNLFREVNTASGAHIAGLSGWTMLLSPSRSLKGTSHSRITDWPLHYRKTSALHVKFTL